MDYKKTGDFLKSLRKANGLTQEEVSNHLMVSPKTISRWECGDGLPDINIISDVAALYNVTVDEILKGEKRVKEENLKEETINLKNKNRDKVLINAILKPFNVLFIVAISISLLFLLIGLIVIFFHFLIGLIIILFSIVVPTILLLVGRKVSKDKMKDNEDIISFDVVEKIKNKLFFRTLNFIDITCINLIVLAIILFAVGYTKNQGNIYLDLFLSIILLISFYLIIRLPLIGDYKPIIKKSSIIAIIILSIVSIAFIFWLTYSNYNNGNRILYFYYLEQYPEMPIERRVNIPDIPFYLILSVTIILLGLFIKIKKAYLLFIPLCFSILAKIPSVFDLKHGHNLDQTISYKISPSITGIILVIVVVIFIILLNKKYKESNNQ